MKGIAFLSGFITNLLTLGITLPAFSQVASDGTTNTNVNTSGNNFNILNGIQRGNNLFHSFKEFSIPTGGEATFENSSTIVNIINRVTGGNISNIDGLIKANGNANLFLINPAGIVFGENARLDIGGSFLGSTAESILFEDGFNFSAVNPQSQPLLTVSVPLGLQMGSNPGNIQVQGTGHNLSLANFRVPLTRLISSNSGLRVKAGNHIALLGANVQLNGGVLAADGAHIEIAAVGNNSEINFNSNNSRWNFDYTGISNFGDINLNQQALADASGETPGFINIKARKLSLTDASGLVIQNLGSQVGGDISVETSESIELIGAIPNTSFQSGLYNEAMSTGVGGNITVSTPKLVMREDGGRISARTFTDSNGGNVTINAKDIEMIAGKTQIGVISSLSAGNGNSGEVTVNTDTLSIFDGGAISAIAFGDSSSAGKITVNATKSIEINDSVNTSASNYRALITASAVNSSGNAGSISINTPRLVLSNGSAISTSTFGNGDAGNININATQSIQIGDDTTELPLTPRIRSSVIVASPRSRQFLGLPDSPKGNSGNITINTPRLSIADGANLTVQNDGIGNAGNIYVNFKHLLLDTGSKITATTASGEGGNIDLNSQASLILRNNSLIDTEALGTGNGGNITVNSPIIAGFENSDIIANAVEGNGGNINITTQGIFGLEFRDRLTEESDITASSEFGVNGTVEINNISIDPSSGLTELPVKLSDSSQQIAQGCSSNNDNSFVATGRGGISQNPKEQVDAKHTWSDIRDLSAFRKANNAQVTTISNKPAIVEATGFIRNADGEIELVAVDNTPLRNKQVAECSS